MTQENNQLCSSAPPKYNLHQFNSNQSFISHEQVLKFKVGRIFYIFLFSLAGCAKVVDNVAQFPRFACHTQCTEGCI